VFSFGKIFTLLSCSFGKKNVQKGQNVNAQNSPALEVLNYAHSYPCEKMTQAVIKPKQEISRYQSNTRKEG